MGFFTRHDANCPCRSCRSTPRGGRNARRAQPSAKEQRRNNSFGAKHDRRNKPTKAKGGTFW
jgi:hypothetical protein